MKRNVPSQQEINQLIALYKNGDLILTKKNASQFIRKYPDFYFGWNILGVVHKELNELNEAISAMQKCIQLAPKDAEARNNIAIMFSELGRLKEAEENYLEAIRLKPDFTQAYINFSNFLQRLERLPEAEAVCRAVIRIQPDYAEAHGSLGNVLHALGRLAEARKSYIEAIGIKPEFYDAHNNLGNVFRDMGRTTDAELSYRKAIELQPNYAEAYNNLGNVLHSLGRLIEAEDAYKKGIFFKPLLPELHNNFANLLKDLGRYPDAESHYREGIRLNPSYAEAYSNLGLLLSKFGKYIEAEESCVIAAKIKPNSSEIRNNLGNVLRDCGKFLDAEKNYREAIRLNGAYAEAYSNLGYVLHDMGRLVEAESNCRASIDLNPTFPQAHNNLGNILHSHERYLDAAGSFREAIRLKPDFFEAYVNLGNVLQVFGLFSEAEASYREAIRINPDYAEAHSNIGNLLNEIRNHVEAEKSCRTAIGLKPEFSEAYNNLGNVLHDMGRLVEAESCYAEALRLKPDLADAHLNLGMTLQEFCCFKEAESCYRESIRLRPNFIKAYDNFLFMVNYDENREIDDIYLEYKKYSKFVQDLGLKKYSHISKRRYQDGRIRIGYVSPDFKGHACRFFMEPLFRSHDKKRFKLYAYSNVSVPDIHTQRLKKYFDVWCDIFSMTDQAVAQRIYDDGIDVLIDLAGHTRGNRLTVFSMKPAPIQVTYPIGTGYTSGLTEIDYFLGDEFLVPEGSDRYFSESIFRLSNPIFCYEHPSDVFFETNDLPFLKNSYITFGSLSRTIRINDKLLSVWKEIISRVPNSRLRLDQKIFSDQSVREEFLNRFDRLGMPIERVELVSSHPHWLSYHEIDVVLDCFPHNAGTTTFESLWMGVPVLTKLDRPSVGRLGASILASLGLNEWIAKDDTDYINKAVHFSSNTEILSALRSSLRSMLEVSELSAPDTITKKLESAYLSIFDKHYPNTDV